MSADARLRTELAAMLDAIEAPAVSIAEIRRRQNVPVPSTPSRTRFGAWLTAAVALIVLSLPLTSPAVMEAIEQRYRAALVALGGEAPPQAPPGFAERLEVEGGNLAAAQARVPFTIVPPAGVPSDARLIKIATAQTGTYDRSIRTWRVDARAVTFSYARAHGRSFVLMADRFDPNDATISKYIFEAEDPGSDGRPVLIKHEHFAWRNGSQVMSATEGRELSAREIERIRSAMHGIALARRNLHVPGRGAAKIYRIPR